MVLQWDRFSHEIKADTGFLVAINAVIVPRAVVLEHGVVAPK